jgi:CRP-like cAMP-binding protein
MAEITDAGIGVDRLSSGHPAAIDPASECGLGTPQIYPPGVELFSQDQRLTDVFRIASGIVKLVYRGSRGQETILGLSFPGSWLGTAPVIADAMTSAAAITIGNVRVRRMPVATFAVRLNGEPRFSSEIHRAHAEELCQQMAWVGRMRSLNSRERVAFVIGQFIASGQPASAVGGVRVQLPIQHWELAQLTAVTPEHLSRLLRQMQSEGIIRRDKGWIVALDTGRLCSWGCTRAWCTNSLGSASSQLNHPGLSESR